MVQQQHQANSGSRRTARTAVLWVAGLLIVVAALVAIGIATEAGEKIAGLREWVEQWGPWAPLAFVVLYVVGSFTARPVSPLAVLGGVVFGAFWGVVWTIAGATLGAAACFLIARHVAREPIERWLRRSKRFRKLDRFTGRHGPGIVAASRLTPLFPFGLANYGFGLSAVGFWTYLLWTWLGSLPGTVVYVVGADAIVRSIEQGRVPWALIAVVAAALAVVGLVAWFVRRRIREDEPRGT